MRVPTNQARAREIAHLLAGAFSHAEGILAERDDLVENQIPRGAAAGSREHAAFLFFVVCHDHGVRSRDLYCRAKDMYGETPWLFSARSVVSRFAGPDDPSLIHATGERLGARYPREAARCWYLNAQSLLTDYHAEPECVFRSSSTASQLLTRICAFRGYGPKTGGMLLRAAIGLGLADVRGEAEVLVPVDVHDARIAFYTGVLDRVDAPLDERLFRACVPQVQRVLRDACREERVSWLDVDRALWLIGSRGCVYRRCSECPLRHICSVGSQRRDAGQQQLAPQE